MAVYFLARASQSCEVEFTRWLMPRLRDPPHGSGVRVARIELLFQLHLIPASSHLLPDLRLSTRSIALLTRPTPVLSLSKMQPSREPSWVGLASSSSYCLLSYRNRGLQWVFHSPQSHSLWCSAPSPPARYSRRRRFQLEQEWRWEGQGWRLGRRFDAVVTVTFSKVWHLKILVVWCGAEVIPGTFVSGLMNPTPVSFCAAQIGARPGKWYIRR